jgi:transcriptional regulator with XRE-family HTH domain
MTFTDNVDIATRHLHITQRLRQRRDELGLTQKQVVTRLGRCGLLTTNRALSSLEHGTGLDVAKLPELAAALDCTVTYLLGLTDDPHSWLPDHELTVPNRAVARPPAAPGAPAAPARAAVPTIRSTPARPASLILGANVPERSIGRR